MSIQNQIQQKAYELGIHKLGIIKPEAMFDYADRLRERMDRIPNGQALYGRFAGFADVKKNIPWAKSIIVAVVHYGHYVLPKGLGSRFGKSYLVDLRFNPNSPEHKMLFDFEDYLHALNIKTASSEHPGITAMRWAAYKAGLGNIRNNNFFYTDKGSWVTITAWAIDKEMELIQKPKPLQCGTNCNKCIAACPTKSLSAPFTMNMANCISRLTTSNDLISYDEQTNKQMGGWIYGCNACQEVCPINKNSWEDEDIFPGLIELEKFLSPEQIMKLTYAQIQKDLMPKFFYINKDSLWRWKLNAINVMVNEFKPEYKAAIEAGLKDENEIVRQTAKQACDTIAMGEV
jgi:epoxyqueuosine reductase